MSLGGGLSGSSFWVDAECPGDIKGNEGLGRDDKQGTGFLESEVWNERS